MEEWIADPMASPIRSDQSRPTRKSEGVRKRGRGKTFEDDEPMRVKMMMIIISLLVLFLHVSGGRVSQGAVYKWQWQPSGSVQVAVCIVS
jgi:hypothetical protein